MTELGALDASAQAADGWRAELELGFARIGGKSALARRRQLGPLTVQRAFYPEGPDVAHLYLLHPPGGVVHGDRLDVRVAVDSGARALLTTPAASKFYRSAGRTALLEQRLSVAEGASLEWLPQETIVYGQASVALKTHVELAPGGVFCGWEIVCLGRPAAGDLFASGRLEQRFEIWQGARPLRIERSRIDPAEPLRSASWGLGGHGVFATLLCAPAPAELVPLVREGVELGAGEQFSASRVGEVLVCRYLGDSAELAKRAFGAAWRALRPALLGRAACPPRIWLT